MGVELNHPAVAATTVRHFPGNGLARREAVLDCGWGRLIFAQTFDSPARIAEWLNGEKAGQRDIALYVEEPQLVLAESPQTLFLDPSIIFRRELRHEPVREDGFSGVLIRALATRSDIAAINRLYSARRMLPVDPDLVWSRRDDERLLFLIAEDARTGDIIGSAMGVDHQAVFADPERGASLWCLVVDGQTALAGVGQALVEALCREFQQRGRRFLDLSVMHDNTQAIALYEKLGFERQPGFVVKHKNAINEPLFVAPSHYCGLNPYAAIIIDEARRRGIGVEIREPESGYFRLSWGGREIWCRESLSELTSAVAMSWCQDKAITLKRLAAEGLHVPRQREAASAAENAAFLAACETLVVKPANGEQGRGISVGIETAEELSQAIERARAFDARVLLEEFCPGQDLRIVVIGYQVVAAAVRRPAEIVGDGRQTVAELITRQSRRREAATGGESRIPMDAETERCLRAAGVDYDSVLPEGQVLAVRRTANLHTGGTIHDVTAELHPKLAEAAERAARTLCIPVVGLDFLVPDVAGDNYVIIEANERPGLANHEPQPTAQRFVDLLFPLSA